MSSTRLVQYYKILLPTIKYGPEGLAFYDGGTIDSIIDFMQIYDGGSSDNIDPPITLYSGGA